MERFSSAYVAALAAAVSNKRHAPPPPPAHSSPPSPLPLPAEPPPIHRAAVVSEMGREQGRRQRDERGMEGLLAGMTRGQRTPSPHCTEPVGGRRDRCGDPLSLRCPLCQAALARAELRDHLHCEIQRLSTLNDSGCQLEPIPEPQYCDPSLSQCGGSEVPLGSPHSGDEEQKMDRQQIFLQVKTNREGRLGVRAGRFKRLKISDDEQESAGKALRQTDSEDDSVDLGYRSPAPLTHNTGHLDAPLRGDTLDSELDGLDSDPEDSLYPADPCQEADPSKRRKADTANGRAGHSEGETAEALRAQITQLTVRLQQRQTQRCHVCLDMYSVPVASIQCWHIHCEDCWLRSLGSKKLCPQCSTITSPGDLRRVFL
ncbi:E3 ubiquitin-protein ligase RNF220-like [Amia ocellicauda]|uniref:E3 ubiquitin-protein ligase RNF220-like n=1 Tax=Amia ocellicauda TaxID=2972642 RepID=UPI003463B06D